MGSTGDILQQAVPKNWVKVAEQPLFQPRRLRVVCVGAGEKIHAQSWDSMTRRVLIETRILRVDDCSQIQI